MKLYAKKQIKDTLERIGSWWGAFSRRMKLRLFRLGRKIKENWRELVIDTAIVVFAAFVGLLIGGFIGMVFVINALLGA